MIGVRATFFIFFLGGGGADSLLDQQLEITLILRHDIFITTTAPFTNTILYSRVTLIESYETYIL